MVVVDPVKIFARYPPPTLDSDKFSKLINDQAYALLDYPGRDAKSNAFKTVPELYFCINVGNAILSAIARKSRLPLQTFEDYLFCSQWNPVERDQLIPSLRELYKEREGRIRVHIDADMFVLPFTYEVTRQMLMDRTLDIIRRLMPFYE